ncbi:hypothetical protein BDZ45DRAFT_802470 [Acephala macrosclerotiorum]|nr:hypothetical protein BDZ45DRAFT_802470 [Acephala macrosclerotiorum]
MPYLSNACFKLWQEDGIIDCVESMSTFLVAGCGSRGICTFPRLDFPSIMSFALIGQAFNLTRSKKKRHQWVLTEAWNIGLSTMPESKLPSTPSRTNIALLRPADPKTVQDIAREILRIFEYAMLEQHRNAGSFQILFPLRAGLGLFRPGCPEWIYLAKYFTDITDNGGFEISHSVKPSGLRWGV